MRHTPLPGTFVWAAAFLAGCGDTPTSQGERIETGGHELAASSAEGARATAQTSDVYEWMPFVTGGDLVQVEGAGATLAWNRSSVTLNVRTADLEPGLVYTVWWVVFDAPENCAVPHGCGIADLAVLLPPFGGDPTDPNPFEATIFGADPGSVAGGTGKATFAGRTRPGDDAGDVLVGDGSLDNPLTAEVHFVVRGHGPAIPGMIREQLSTFDGGCDVNARRA